MQMTAAQRARAVAAPEPEGHFKYLFLNNICFASALALLCMLMTAAAHAQAPVARVLETKGTTLVERSGQMPRLLGAGETLSERDTVNVARESWAIIEFNDQTRVSLRPNTVFRLDTYKPDAPETMLLGLVKGGLRVVTGLFGKRNPQGVKVQTAVATIGIRGTEFDARLCAEDCAAEEKAAPASRPVVLPVARVVEMNGVVGAGRAGESVRLLVPGAMLNEGDAVAVGRGGSALLVFRDGARVALVENSRFAINRFRFNEAQPREGSAFLTLYAGNALVTTGQLAKISPDAFLFRTALGVVRPFGTTFGAGGCIGSLCASGSVTVNSDGASASGSASGGGASGSASATANSSGASASASATDGSRTVAASGSTGGVPGGTPAFVETAGRFVSQGAQHTVDHVVDWVAGTPGNELSSPGQRAPTRILGDAAEVLNQVGANVEGKVRGAAGDSVVDAVVSGVERINRPQSPSDNWNVVADAVSRASDAAVQGAVNALNAATTPIINEMTALVTQIRNNPPSTEAASRELFARASQLSQQMSAVMSGALAGAGSVADASAFKIAVGMLQLMYLEFNGTMGQAAYSTSINVPIGISFSQVFFGQLQAIRNTPYLASSFEAIGISNADIDHALFWQVPDSAVVGAASALSPGRLMRAKEILEVESSQWMMATGSAAANALFAEARAASDAARQRAEQEAAAAKQAASQRGDIGIGGLIIQSGNTRCLDDGDCRILARVPGPPAPYVPVPFPNTPYSERIFSTGNENDQNAGSEQPSTNDSGQATTENIATVTVWEGSVEVVGRGRIAQGEMFDPTGNVLRLASRTIPVSKIDPELFSSNNKPVEEGLYVWVRAGAVQLAKDDQSVDVGAGNSAVATKDRVRLLDVVPNFLRFDSTPRPFPAFGDTKVDTFRAADGAFLNMCTVR